MTNDFTKFLKQRHSVRKFQAQDVAPEQLLQLLEAASFAPSPHNRQPWRFAVLTQLATRQKLAQAMGERWKEQMLTDEIDEQTIQKRLKASFERIVNAPALILPCLYLAKMDSYPDEARQTAETTMAIQSLGAAIQNILLMAESLGLACGWLSAPLFCPAVVRNVLNLDEAFIPHALILVGYEAGKVENRPRPSLDTLIIHLEC